MAAFHGDTGTVMSLLSHSGDKMSPGSNKPCIPPLCSYGLEIAYNLSNSRQASVVSAELRCYPASRQYCRVYYATLNSSCSIYRHFHIRSSASLQSTVFPSFPLLFFVRGNFHPFVRTPIDIRSDESYGKTVPSAEMFDCVFEMGADRFASSHRGGSCLIGNRNRWNCWKKRIHRLLESPIIVYFVQYYTRF